METLDLVFQVAETLLLAASAAINALLWEENMFAFIYYVTYSRKRYKPLSKMYLKALTKIKVLIDFLCGLFVFYPCKASKKHVVNEMLMTNYW